MNVKSALLRVCVGVGGLRCLLTDLVTSILQHSFIVSGTNKTNVVAVGVIFGIAQDVNINSG